MSRIARRDYRCVRTYLNNPGFSIVLRCPRLFGKDAEMGKPGERALQSASPLRSPCPMRPHAKSVEHPRARSAVPTVWNYEIVRRMLYQFGQGHKPPDTSRSGIEESGARTAADAKRPKSIVSKGAERPSLIDFSGAGADVSLSLHSRDLFWFVFRSSEK